MHLKPGIHIWAVFSASRSIKGLTFFVGRAPQKEGIEVVPIILPEANIASKNGWLEYYFPIGEANFQGRLLLVSGSHDFQKQHALYHSSRFSWFLFGGSI